MEKLRQQPVQAVLALLGMALVLAAIVQELRKPVVERTWHGLLGGIIPYDFRPPTWERVREAWWNPESNRLFTPRVWGIGWAVNLPVLFDRVRAFAQD